MVHMNTKNIENDKYSLKNLGKVNVILGKNGCGKSTLLKEIETYLQSDDRTYGKIKYISPERGGVLNYDPSVENNIENNKLYLTGTRRQNRVSNFREQSIAQFRKLELLFYREKEKNVNLSSDPNYKFENYFNKINSLLDHIEVRSDGQTFKIYQKEAEVEISSGQISSGESELISLGIECLVFQKECIFEKLNVLLLDEPDVHLHPDLQERLGNFLRRLIEDKNATIIIATHSTAFLSALESYDDTCIEFMDKKQTGLNFKRISDEYRKILPVFGAHPLSNLFNEAPVFLVEGEDDERIWQQAVRTSNKKLKIYPCSTDGVDNMKRYESEVEQIIRCVYENARAFSLRD